jgi:purine catabolism regulator
VDDRSPQLATVGLTANPPFFRLEYGLTVDTPDRSGTGGISVGDLAQLPHLQATVLAGASGLNRKVSWAHVTESDKPWNWLEPGDLVLTSGVIVPRSASAQVRFVGEMATFGLSGIVIGEDDRRPILSDRMLEAANRSRFPVLSAGYEVSFAQWVRVVAAANERGENRSLSQIMRVHSEVLTALMQQRSSAAFLGGLSRVAGCGLHVIDPESWEPLLKDCGVPDRSWRAAYDTALGKRAGRVPTVIHLTVSEQTAIAIPVPIERSACLIAFPENEPAPRLAVLQQVAAACALEVGRLDAGVERERRSGAGLLSDALEGRLEPHVLEAHFADRGLDSALLAFALDGRSPAIDRMARSWAIREVPFLMGAIRQVEIGVIPSDDALLGEFAERTRSEPLRAGVSDPFSGAGGLSDAVRQARWALETVNPDAWGLARYGDGTHGFLPRTLSESQLAANHVLGQLIEYDLEHDTDLIKTLQTYLECDRSPSQAGKLLFVHTQTVNYRLTRIQELTGRSMRSTGDVSELWFALRALALCQTDH